VLTRSHADRVCVLFASDVMSSAAYQWRKNVIITIDVSNTLSYTQLQITKAVAKHIVFSLGDNDWVSHTHNHKKVFI